MKNSPARGVARRGITANAISPGFISTPMTDALTPAQVEAIAAAIPTRTFGKPEDVAAAVVFLASNEAAYITGETMHVNGGVVMVSALGGKDLAQRLRQVWQSSFPRSGLMAHCAE